MSGFLPAHKEVMGNEGGVNYNPADRGNVIVKGIVTLPTYKGIAPAFWPKCNTVHLTKVFMPFCREVRQEGYLWPELLLNFQVVRE